MGKYRIREIFTKWKFKTERKLDKVLELYIQKMKRLLEELDEGINTNAVHEKWRFKTGGAIYSSPAISDNVIYFGSLDGYLYALDIEAREE